MVPRISTAAFLSPFRAYLSTSRQTRTRTHSYDKENLRLLPQDLVVPRGDFDRACYDAGCIHSTGRRVKHVLYSGSENGIGMVCHGAAVLSVPYTCTLSWFVLLPGTFFYVIYTAAILSCCCSQRKVLGWSPRKIRKSIKKAWHTSGWWRCTAVVDKI